MKPISSVITNSREREVEFKSFPKVLALCKKQAASSRI